MDYICTVDYTALFYGDLS